MMMFNFFKIAMKLKGYPLKNATIELSIIQNMGNKEFVEYIEKKKWEQFKFHLENNSFYRNFIDKKQIQNWTDIPILSKSDIQKPIKETITNGFDLSNVFKNNTSGSSGKPFYFVKDKMTHARTWALILNRYSMHGIEYGKSLQARFYGIPITGVKYYKEKFKDYVSARVRFPVFNLSDDKLKEFTQKFKKHKFEYINGYTSSLVLYANYLINNKIVLKDLCPTLKICFPTSEMCSKPDRLALEKGFGVKVANEYGCAEMDILAFEDENFDWIMSSENVYFEVVDDNGNVLPQGVEGRLIITSLSNKAMPFIRYELGDIAKIGKNKKNTPILSALTGRTNEFAILPNGRKVPALTFYYITKTLIQEEYKIKEFVIKQTSIYDFVFEYVAENSLNQNACNKIQIAMDEYLEPGLRAHFLKMPEIERTKAGKLKQFSNLINL
jgi:phenylacetate-CoA ligase